MNLIRATSSCKQHALHIQPSFLPSFSNEIHQRPRLAAGSRSVSLQTAWGGRSLRLERFALSSVKTQGNPGLHCRAELADVAPVTAAIYGASLLGGGLIACEDGSTVARTGSKGSLGGGITGGVTLGLALSLMQVPETQGLGNAIGFGASLLFASVFGIRLAATGKALPSGALLGISALASVIFANAYFQSKL